MYRPAHTFAEPFFPYFFPSRRMPNLVKSNWVYGIRGEPGHNLGVWATQRRKRKHAVLLLQLQYLIPANVRQASPGQHRAWQQQQPSCREQHLIQHQRLILVSVRDLGVSGCAVRGFRGERQPNRLLWDVKILRLEGHSIRGIGSEKSISKA